MTGFRSPIARKSLAYVLAAGGALTGMLSLARPAQAQQEGCVSGACGRDAEGDAIALSQGRSYVDQKYKELQAQGLIDAQGHYIVKAQPPVDPSLARAQAALMNTADNRLFAKRVYEAALEGIGQVLRAEGKAKAIALSQNPQDNLALMTVLKQAHSGQYFLAQTIVVDSMVDGFALANGETKSTFRMVNNWDADVAFAANYLARRPHDRVELTYLELQSESAGAFGPKNKVAARAVIAAHRAG